RRLRRLPRHRAPFPRAVRPPGRRTGDPAAAVTTERPPRRSPPRGPAAAGKEEPAGSPGHPPLLEAFRVSTRTFTRHRCWSGTTGRHASTGPSPRVDRPRGRAHGSKDGEVWSTVLWDGRPGGMLLRGSASPW